MLPSFKRFTATSNEPGIECVLIHGWGLSSCIWSTWLPLVRTCCNVTVVELPGYGGSELSDYNNMDALVADLLEQLPQQAVYIGYSLGGMLALHIAAHYPERVQAVITMASNLKFVADDFWHTAMPPKTFEAFYRGVNQNAKKALNRFMALQVKGAENEKTLLKTLKDLSEGEIFCEPALRSSLELLAAIDCRSVLGALNMPRLHVLAQNDQLVPFDVAGVYREQFNETVEVINGAPHAMFISHPEQSWALIHQFLLSHKIRIENNSGALNKKHVARSFSRAAATYDSVADLQRQVGQQLQSYLPDNPAGVVLDLGCGTGFFSEPLNRRYSSACVVGLDLAEGMVKFAADRHAGNNAAWLCGDAENIPLADNSVDVVFSSLAIQWCEDHDALFAEVARVLKPGRTFLVSTLGPNTLHELRDAWCNVDNYVHVNQFVDQRTLVRSAQRAGFVNAMDELHLASGSNVVEQTITMEYDTLKNLTHELKCLGAHNINSGRPTGLMGKTRLRTFVQGYEKQRNDRGLLPASYQVWYGAWRKTD